MLTLRYYDQLENEDLIDDEYVAPYDAQAASRRSRSGDAPVSRRRRYKEDAPVSRRRRSPTPGDAYMK